MIVQNWMTTDVMTLKPLDTALHARAMLEEHRIRQAPVAVNGKVVGIVTDRDLRDVFPSVFDEQYHTAHKQSGWTNPEKVTVETVMSLDVITVGLNDSLKDVAVLMAKERIGAIPVIDHGRLVGMLTRTDVLRAFITLCDTFEDRLSDRPRQAAGGG